MPARYTLILIRGVFISAIILLSASSLRAQVRISGRVYDITQSRPLEAVSVLSTSGHGTISDSLGRYSIVVKETDSIWFSYLNKPTPKFSVNSIPNTQNFEIALHVHTTELKEVRFMPPNYHMDSLQNRLDYAKAFNFQKPGIGSSLSVSPMGAGLDLDEFINMFQFRRNRRMAHFRDRLLREEEEKYIDYRFSRSLIIRLTNLRGAELDTFAARYRPTVEFARNSTDYEFQLYIKKCFLHYQKYRDLMKEFMKPDM